MKRQDPNIIFHDLIGQPLTDDLREQFSDARIKEPGYAYTMDHNPFRLNVHVDKDGIITKFTYG